MYIMLLNLEQFNFNQAQLQAGANIGIVIVANIFIYTIC